MKNTKEPHILREQNPSSFGRYEVYVDAKDISDEVLKTSAMSALKFSQEHPPPILKYQDFRTQITRNISPFALSDLMQAHQNSASQITEKTIISADMSIVFSANARSQICSHSFLKFRRR